MIRKNILKMLVISLVIFLVLIVGLVLVKRYIFFSRSTPLCKDCNILLISLDTCGAQHMSTYGYTRDTTPNLTALASQGVLFKNMHANATWTLPSHASIFTGLYPSVHQIQKGYDKYLDPSIPLLPDILQQQGYDTYFFAPNDELNIAPVHVYNRGINHWDEQYWAYRGKEDQYLTLALDQLEKNNEAGKKTFMFFHTYMCHGPYLPEDQPLLYTDNKIPSLPLKKTDVFDAPFTEDFYHYLLERMPQGIRDGDFHVAPEKIKEFYLSLQQAPDFLSAKKVYEDAVNQNTWGESAFGGYEEDFNYWAKIDVTNKEHIEYIKALYDQGMHTMDEKLFSLFRELRASSSWSKNTIVIITADHGEEFMEHGNLSHASLYDANTRVPLILLIPGIEKKTIDEHMQSVDIMPSILELVGVKSSSLFNGKSLVPLLFGRSLGKRLIIANGEVPYQSDLMTLREGDWQLFVQNINNTVSPYELYNTKKEPQEQMSVLVNNMDVAKKMIQEYTQLQGKKFQSQ